MSHLRFWSMPKEVAEDTLALCRPQDVASFSQTSRAAWSFVNVSSDPYLWCQLFLRFPFDDPRKTRHGFCGDVQFDWKTELQRRVRAETLTRSPRSSPEDLHEALATLLSVVRSAPPVMPGYDCIPSRSLLWVKDLLESTNIFHRPPFTWHHTCQTLACLRAYLALTLDKFGGDEGLLHVKSVRTRSRCQVYDLGNCIRNRAWGPLQPNTEEVDWFYVESIMNVIAFNLADRSRHFTYAKPPCGLEATRAYSAPCTSILTPNDWAGVEGNWRRIISFLNYRDLFAFNEEQLSTWTHVDRCTGRESFFENAPNITETTRLIELRFDLISPDAIPDYYTLDRFPEPKDTKFPTLYFSGSSSSDAVNGGEAAVVGSVYMADDGVVRWRFASAYESRMQWSSDGVQIGGIGSATGVVGTWTGAHHDQSDPVGPFWLWKVPDDYPSLVGTH